MRKFLLSISFLLMSMLSFGQCAMCKAVAEQGVDQEIAKGGGINSAIIFIIIVVYVCLVGFIIIAFRKKLWKFWQELKNAGK